MRVRPFFLLLLIVAAVSVGAGACGQGFPAALTPSSCRGGPDRCGALNCPAGTHCTLTSSCAAICEQEQLTNH